MTIEQQAEYAITRDEWEELQMIVDAENQLVALDDDQRVIYNEALEELNRLCVRSALDDLLERHQVEFVALLRAHRRLALLNSDPEFMDYVHTVVTS